MPSKKDVNKWYRVQPVDYYGELEIPVGLKDKRETFMIRSGMQIEVWWPNNQILRAALVIETGHTTMQIDMNGSPDEVTTQKLYVRGEVNGIMVLVPLKRLKIRPVGIVKSLRHDYGYYSNA